MTIPQKETKANKRMGQNFLTDETVLTGIAGAVEIKKTDILIEIGPGHGELTEKLLSFGPDRVIAIEKDPELAKSIKNKELSDNFEVIEGDALKILPELTTQLQTTNYKLVGNIPYYITGYLLRVLGELEHKPEIIVLMIQKEVAQRICAKPGKMNLLSASVQFWGNAEIAGFVSKNAFNPRPKVDSAVIRIVPSKGSEVKPLFRRHSAQMQMNTFSSGSLASRNKKPIVNSEKYYEAIKIIFKQPRKTILNNLKDAVKTEKISERTFKKIVLEKAELISKRPQDLDIANLESFALYF